MYLYQRLGVSSKTATCYFQNPSDPLVLLLVARCVKSEIRNHRLHAYVFAQLLKQNNIFETATISETRHHLQFLRSHFFLDLPSTVGQMSPTSYNQRIFHFT